MSIRLLTVESTHTQAMPRPLLEVRIGRSIARSLTLPACHLYSAPKESKEKRHQTHNWCPHQANFKLAFTESLLAKKKAVFIVVWKKRKNLHTHTQPTHILASCNLHQPRLYSLFVIPATPLPFRHTAGCKMVRY